MQGYPLPEYFLIAYVCSLILKNRSSLHANTLPKAAVKMPETPQNMGVFYETGCGEYVVDRQQ